MCLADIIGMNQMTSDVFNAFHKLQHPYSSQSTVPVSEFSWELEPKNPAVNKDRSRRQRQMGLVVHCLPPLNFEYKERNERELRTALPLNKWELVQPEYNNGTNWLPMELVCPEVDSIHNCSYYNRFEVLWRSHMYDEDPENCLTD